MGGEGKREKKKERKKKRKEEEQLKAWKSVGEKG